MRPMPEQDVVYVGDEVPLRARVVRPLISHAIIWVPELDTHLTVPMELLRAPPVRLVSTRPDEDEDGLPRGAA